MLVNTKELSFCHHCDCMTWVMMDDDGVRYCGKCKEKKMFRHSKEDKEKIKELKRREKETYEECELEVKYGDEDIRQLAEDADDLLSYKTYLRNLKEQHNTVASIIIIGVVWLIFSAVNGLAQFSFPWMSALNVFLAVLLGYEVAHFEILSESSMRLVDTIVTRAKLNGRAKGK